MLGSHLIIVFVFSPGFKIDQPVTLQSAIFVNALHKLQSIQGQAVLQTCFLDSFWVLGNLGY